MFGLQNNIAFFACELQIRIYFDESLWTTGREIGILRWNRSFHNTYRLFMFVDSDRADFHYALSTKRYSTFA